MQFGSCLLQPPASWQHAICADPPIGLIWPQANYYSTAAAGAPHWMVAVNNEPAFEVGPCTTGIPNRSRAVNEGPFSLRHDAQSITLRLENTSDDNCRKIPYLAINNFDSRTLAGTYGDRMHFAFTVTSRISVSEKHLQFFHFFVRLTDAHGNPKFAWLDLYAPPGVGEALTNWNWPIASSAYDPGALIRAMPISSYSAVSDKPLPTLVPGTTQAYDIDLDRVLKAVFPADAVPTTRIHGIEIAVEHDFDWTASPPLGTIVTEMTLTDVRAYRAN